MRKFWLMDNPPDPYWWHYNHLWPVPWSVADLSTKPQATDVYWYEGINLTVYNANLLRQQFESGAKIIWNTSNESADFQLLGLNHTIIQEFPDQLILITSQPQPTATPGVVYISVPQWYWFLEKSKKLEFQNFNNTNQYCYKFLLLMNTPKLERRQLWHAFGDLLTDSLHSFVGMGIHIDNDIPEAYSHVDQNWRWDRHINPMWYNQTMFSIVAETKVRDTKLGHGTDYFITEKTFKPIMMQHPFLLFSTQHALKTLRTFGFETFPELWSENYDDLNRWQYRLDALVSNVKNFDPAMLSSKIIKEKLQHNQQLFFNQSHVDLLFQKHVVNPVMELVND